MSSAGETPWCSTDSQPPWQPGLGAFWAAPASWVTLGKAARPGVIRVKTTHQGSCSLQTRVCTVCRGLPG